MAKWLSADSDDPTRKEKKANACSHASKIILKILTKRIEAKATAVNWITNEQFGFRKGVGTRDAIGQGVLNSLLLGRN